jgi:hypothetical protein
MKRQIALMREWANEQVDAEINTHMRSSGTQIYFILMYLGVKILMCIASRNRGLRVRIEQIEHTYFVVSGN